MRIKLLYVEIFRILILAKCVRRIQIVHYYLHYYITQYIINNFLILLNYYVVVDIKMGGKKDNRLIYERLSTIC